MQGSRPQPTSMAALSANSTAVNGSSQPAISGGMQTPVSAHAPSSSLSSVIASARNLAGSQSQAITPTASTEASTIDDAEKQPQSKPTSNYHPEGPKLNFKEGLADGHHLDAFYYAVTRRSLWHALETNLEDMTLRQALGLVSLKVMENPSFIDRSEIADDEVAFKKWKAEAEEKRIELERQKKAKEALKAQRVAKKDEIKAEAAFNAPSMAEERKQRVEARREAKYREAKYKQRHERKQVEGLKKRLRDTELSATEVEHPQKKIRIRFRIKGREMDSVTKADEEVRQTQPEKTLDLVIRNKKPDADT